MVNQSKKERYKTLLLCSSSNPTKIQMAVEGVTRGATKVGHKKWWWDPRAHVYMYYILVNLGIRSYDRRRSAAPDLISLALLCSLFSSLSFPLPQQPQPSLLLLPFKFKHSNSLFTLRSNQMVQNKHPLSSASRSFASLSSNKNPSNSNSNSVLIIIIIL